MADETNKPVGTSGNDDAIVQVAIHLSGTARDVQLVRRILLQFLQPGRVLALSLPELAGDGLAHVHGTITLIPDPQIE